MDTKTRLFQLIDAQFPSYPAFERAFGLTARTTNNWKMGKSSSYLKMLPALARTLNTTTAYLLCETDNPTQSRALVDKNGKIVPHDAHLKAFEGLQNYEIPAMLGQILADRLNRTNTLGLERLKSHLKVTPAEKIEAWKRGEGQMDNFEYGRFLHVFGHSYPAKFNTENLPAEPDGSFRLPENIYEFATPQNAKKDLKEALSHAIGRDVSDETVAKVLEYARFVAG